MELGNCGGATWQLCKESSGVWILWDCEKSVSGFETE